MARILIPNLMSKAAAIDTAILDAYTDRVILIYLTPHGLVTDQDVMEQN